MSILRKGAKADWNQPTSEQRRAIADLKKELIKPLISSLPKKGRYFMADTDASEYVMGPPYSKKKSLIGKKGVKHHRLLQQTIFRHRKAV